MEVNDYIVVGSGCCGALAAKTIVDKGLQLLMLDAGKIETEKQKSFHKSFIDFRLTETNQQEELLGENFIDQNGEIKIISINP